MCFLIQINRIDVEQVKRDAVNQKDRVFVQTFVFGPAVHFCLIHAPDEGFDLVHRHVKKLQTRADYVHLRLIDALPAD